MAAIVAAAALGLAGFCHVATHDGVTLRLDSARTPYPAAAQPVATPPAPRLAERVWLIILDGLRDDAVAAMPSLSRFAEGGVRRTLLAAFPSYTFGGITAFATGVEPRDSGVRLNGGRVRPPYDTLARAAARSGVATLVAVQSRRNARLVDARIGHTLPAVAPAETIGRPIARELIWMQLDDIDIAGHAYGAASPRYAEAARRVDAQLAPLLAAIDLSREAVVIVSDHGQVDGGGHGGAEHAARAGVLVAAGAGVRRGLTLPPARGVDVCSTVAALLGIAPPADNLGAPMLDLVSGDGARIGAPARVQRADAERRLDRPALERARAERQRLRVAVAALAAVLLMFVWLVPESWRPSPLDLVPALVYATVFASGWLVAGYRLSWTLPRGEAHFVLETALLGAGAAAIALVFARAPLLGASDGRTLCRAALVWPLAIVVAAATAPAGVDPAWLASPRESFTYVAVATAAFWLALAGAADVALSVAASARRRRAVPTLRASRTG
jgi:hypothetical protein